MTVIHRVLLDQAELELIYEALEFTGQTELAAVSARWPADHPAKMSPEQAEQIAAALQALAQEQERLVSGSGQRAAQLALKARLG